MQLSIIVSIVVIVAIIAVVAIYAGVRSRRYRSPATVTEKDLEQPGLGERSPLGGAEPGRSTGNAETEHNVQRPPAPGAEGHPPGSSSQQ